MRRYLRPSFTLFNVVSSQQQQLDRLSQSFRPFNRIWARREHSLALESGSVQPVTSQQYSHCVAYVVGRRTKHNRFGLRSFYFSHFSSSILVGSDAGSRRYCLANAQVLRIRIHILTRSLSTIWVAIRSNGGLCIKAFTIRISISILHTKNEHIKLDLVLNRFDQ